MKLTPFTQGNRGAKNRADVAPTFAAAHLMVILVVLVTGLATTANAIASIHALGLAMPTAAMLMAITGAIAFGISMIPIMSAPAFTLAEDADKITGFVLLLPIMLADACSMTFTVLTFDEALRTAAAEAAGKSWVAESSFHWAMILPVCFAVAIALFFFRGWLTKVTMKIEDKIEARRAEVSTEVETLRVRARELGIPVRPQWGVPRLTKEIAAANKPRMVGS